MATKPNRKSILDKITRTASGLGTLKGKVIEETWNLAYLFVELQGTYPNGKDGTAAFKTTAATAASCTEGYVENLVRAVSVREGMTKAQRAKVDRWSTDAVLTLSNLDTANRAKLIAKVDKAGTQNVKVIRDLKRQVTGAPKGTRNKKGKAARDTALAKEIGERVAEAVASGRDYLSMIVGAQIAQDHPGKDVAAALTLISTQAAKAAEVVAK